MKMPSIILAAALLLTGAGAVVSTLGVRVATAQVSAPTAGLIPSQSSFAAGAPATFKGRGFAPGEIVRFQVSHVRGTSETDFDHTPMAVVADPSGAFVATWLVCTTDCVGELLSINATGQTSGKIGRAMFMDLSAPPGAAGQASMKGHALESRAIAPSAAAAAAPTFERIHSFGSPGTGYYPYARLVQGTDGALYGTALYGGTNGAGTVFKLNPDGSGFTVLKSFDYSTTGAYPFAGVVQGTDGALYGTAY